MFAISRYLLVALLAVSLLIVVKKKQIRLKKGITIIAVILLWLLTGLLKAVPFENLFVTFTSPEQVFSYMQLGEIINITEGEKSSLIFFNVNHEPYIEPSFMIIPKNGKGYKLGTDFTLLTIVELKKNHSPFVDILRCRNTDDYYVRVYEDINSDSIEISDSCGSEFNRYFWKTDGLNTTNVWCCAYVKDIGSEYRLTINGETTIINIPHHD